MKVVKDQRGLEVTFPVYDNLLSALQILRGSHEFQIQELI